MTTTCCAPTCGAAAATSAESVASAASCLLSFHAMPHACLSLTPCCSGPSCRLEQLKLNVRDISPPELKSTISRHMQPTALEMSAWSPACVAWVPQLTQCFVSIHSNEQLSKLAASLGASQAQLRKLTVSDKRQPVMRDAVPITLPGLAQLPALCQLVRGWADLSARAGQQTGVPAAAARPLTRAFAHPLLCRSSSASTACRWRCGPALASHPCCLTARPLNCPRTLLCCAQGCDSCG